MTGQLHVWVDMDLMPSGNWVATSPMLPRLVVELTQWGAVYTHVPVVARTLAQKWRDRGLYVSDVILALASEGDWVDTGKDLATYPGYVCAFQPHFKEPDL